MSQSIKIHKASENNLKAISLEIPKNKLVVVTGVSGSGKSSLAYDVIYREAENRYLSTFSTHARQFLAKMKKPAVEKIDGLSPAIAVNQKTVIRNPRSTVGTVTGIYDYLRLLFARLGKSQDENADFKIDRNLFSFNTPAGACPHCQGLGVEDRIDPELIVADVNKSLRQGAFVITAPNGYIIYSQVTMDVLDEVCRAEGFNVDISWKDLTAEQKNVVLYGSNKIEIPFGKHTLESRMKWSGITAKPRDTGFYKGVIPVMADILRRDRNKNILRFVRSQKCHVCQGSRLNEKALSVVWQNVNIAQLSQMSVKAMGQFIKSCTFDPHEKSVAEPLTQEILKIVDQLEKLGCGYLQINRESTGLSGGESQRLRLASQLSSNLRGIIYIFDEPSIGLHPSENKNMIEVLQGLRDKGNSVIVVEHDDDYLHHADHIIDIGPAAGINGGEVLFNASADELPNLKIENSKTLDYFLGREVFKIAEPGNIKSDEIAIVGAAQNNLKNIEAVFKTHTLNVVAGVSGAGKSTLVEQILSRYFKTKLHAATAIPGKHEGIRGGEEIKKVVMIDQSPIGRTPRSNPATYTKLGDHLRDLFAALPASKAQGWKKGRFSFNVAGGRCEACQGAGYQQVGMHFLGDVEIVCDACNGQRFNEDTLAVKFQDKSIYEVLELSVAEALDFFRGQDKTQNILKTLHELGLGYIKLGQRSTTLSGGEAQRIKLAAELANTTTAHTLYILDEPTIGLHNADVKVLLESLLGLVKNNNTLVVVEHHPGVIAAAGHLIELGPGSGNDGGQLVFQGSPDELLQKAKTLTALALRTWLSPTKEITPPQIAGSEKSTGIQFKGITTHNLKNLNIEIPANKITVITGVSGSGKSSLAFDTLYAEGRNRFMESFSPYVRAQIGMEAKADFAEVEGLTPVVAISRQGMKTGSRSTLGTMTGIYDLYRLLFSRCAHHSNKTTAPFSSLFSFNHQHGACKSCDGLGEIIVADVEKLISHPEKSLGNGAMDGHKWGKFYGDPFGQYIHTLLAVGQGLGFDYDKSWNDLSEKEKQVAMYGTGDENYEITWKYKRGKREGEHHFKGQWQGFVNLVNLEYRRKHADKRGDSMLAIMKHEICPACNGARLNDEALKYSIAGKNISDLSDLSVDKAIDFFEDYEKQETQTSHLNTSKQLRSEILQKLRYLNDLGLAYLSVSRNASTLSGGELQRVRLASQVGNGLTGVTYVLDEPTVGLHSRDTAKLMEIIYPLRDAGNTVVIVEHDPEVMLAADHLIELGPEAGENGGHLIAKGTPQEMMQNPQSPIGNYLAKAAHDTFAVEVSEDEFPEIKSIQIKSAFAHNLKNLDIKIPLGKMVCISGVSGSGKSTLVFDVIAASASADKAMGCKAIEGLEQFAAIVQVNQQALSTSQLSNALTFTGIFDWIRDLFAKTQEAKQLQLKKTHFSFNTKGGRCEKCQGQGKIRISLDFVSDVWIPCDECQGLRYQPQILQCTIAGKNINDVLEMTLAQAQEFFGFDKKICEALALLAEVGLGYLKLGQATSTMSGGELQRLKLAKELMQCTQGQKLYLLDEPTTGLNFSDVEQLLCLFRKLTDQGNTLLIIEHNQDVIEQCDWLITLGPEGGEKGGELISAGRPVAKT